MEMNHVGSLGYQRGCEQAAGPKGLYNMPPERLKIGVEPCQPGHRPDRVPGDALQGRKPEEPHIQALDALQPRAEDRLSREVAEYGIAAGALVEEDGAEGRQDHRPSAIPAKDTNGANGSIARTLTAVNRRDRLAGVVAGAARCVQGAMWLPVCHLAAISVAGSLPPRPVSPGGARHRFVVLVPARNEQAQVHLPVVSVQRSTYPPELRRVVVVADNCTDATASEARAHGAEVWERFEPQRLSKGAAVAWALERLLTRHDWDAVVLLDADGEMAPHFLDVVDGRLAAGADVVQGERHVSNATENVVARLAQVSSAAQCVLRPRGRARLGGSPKLVGNGMVIRRRVLVRCPWRAEGLVEDFEYWLQLLQHGIHPVHEPCAVVSDLMPTDVASARVQRSRWEAGRANLVRDHLGRCIRLAVRRRDPVLAEAAISELLFPNLSVTGGMVAAAGMARWVVTRKGAVAATAQATAIAAHLVLSLRAVKAPPATYAALAVAPVVGTWRLLLTAQAVMRRRSLGWEGTPRGVRAPR